MRKINCWEFKQCGRQPGGHNEKEFGTCATALKMKFNKINRGVNGGRFCWHVTDSFCEFDTHGSFAKDSNTCKNCEFRKLVEQEEDSNFIE